MALDLWGFRIWLNVSIFYQFHKAKSRYLSSEPGHWFKKQLSKFSWNQSKDLTFAQIFAFCDLNVIFDNSNWIECVYILKFQIGVNSKAEHNSERLPGLKSALCWRNFLIEHPPEESYKKVSKTLILAFCVNKTKNYWN